AARHPYGRNKGIVFHVTRHDQPDRVADRRGRRDVDHGPRRSRRLQAVRQTDGTMVFALPLTTRLPGASSSPLSFRKRARRQPGQARRRGCPGPHAGGHPVRALARRDHLRTRAAARDDVAPVGCDATASVRRPQAVIGQIPVGLRPRNADCDPPTLCNLSATEREYSIATARRSTRSAERLLRILWASPPPPSITLDHGTEFRSRALEDWAYRRS